jgi:hypothetical protein
MESRTPWNSLCAIAMAWRKLKQVGLLCVLTCDDASAVAAARAGVENKRCKEDKESGPRNSFYILALPCQKLDRTRSLYVLTCDDDTARRMKMDRFEEERYARTGGDLSGIMITAVCRRGTVGQCPDK